MHIHKWLMSLVRFFFYLFECLFLLALELPFRILVYNLNMLMLEQMYFDISFSILYSVYVYSIFCLFIIKFILWVFYFLFLIFAAQTSILCIPIIEVNRTFYLLGIEIKLYTNLCKTCFSFASYLYRPVYKIIIKSSLL